MQAVAKGKKKIKATGGPKKPAFVLPNEAQKHVSQTLSNLTSAGHIPKGWSTKSLHHCFEHPGFLKAHDWLLLAGPVGKYALQVQSCYEKWLRSPHVHLYLCYSAQLHQSWCKQSMQSH
jgi:hypothetical protein